MENRNYQRYTDEQRVFIVKTFYKLTNSVAQEPEGSSPHSQQPATGPCSEPVECNLQPRSQSP
jgi:hypothetical protein